MLSVVDDARVHAQDGHAAWSESFNEAIQASGPWAEAITAAWLRIDALPQAPDQHETVPPGKKGDTGLVEPPATGPPSYPDRKSGTMQRLSHPGQPSARVNDLG
jgi:hypothetical protein